MAVLTRLPVAEGEAVPVTVKVTEFPAPAAMLTTAARVLPEPVAPLVTAALPAVVDVQVTPVRVAGTRSLTGAPTAFDGPAFVTVIV